MSRRPSSRSRNHEVRLLDAGTPPTPDAASTDISKLVRLDYGDDLGWVTMAEECLPLWREWNVRFRETLFTATGIAILSREPLRPSGFEHDSLRTLEARGWRLERLDEATIRARLPAFATAGFVDGYFNPHDGFARSGAVVARLLAECEAIGVTILRERPCVGLRQQGRRVTGVALQDGTTLSAEVVVIAAGAWTPQLLPWLADRLTSTGQSVLCFAGEGSDVLAAPQLVPWTADIATTGWYGFPTNEDGVVKVGHHGPGTPIAADAPRKIDPGHEARCREFLRSTLPALADRRIVERRLCLYCDSFDNAFLIDRDPDRPGLIVATGGSGHAFKFAPITGGIVADVVEGRPDRFAGRFAWREGGPPIAERSRRS